jgi:hypothetical protein
MQLGRVEDKRRLILAYDDNCGTCRDLASVITGAQVEGLEVRSLGSPEVRRWQREFYGSEADAPWLPTLIEPIDAEGRVRMWPGRKMALPLASRMGPRNAWKVVTEVGRFRTSGSMRTESVRPGLSRNTFLYGVSGIAVGMSILGSAKPRVSAAALDHRVAHQLSGPDLASAYATMLMQADVGNVLSPALRELLSTADPLPARSHADSNLLVVRYSQERSTQISEGVVEEGVCAVFQQTTHQLANGESETISALSIPAEDLALALHQYLGNSGGVDTEAILWDTSHIQSDGMHAVEMSLNGSPPDLLDVSHDSSIRLASHVSSAQDPCDGCVVMGNSASGQFLSTVCRSTNVVNCVLTGVGCVGCGPSACNPAAITAACVTCVISVCGVALRTCCDSQGQACLRCPQQD